MVLASFLAQIVETRVVVASSLGARPVDSRGGPSHPMAAYVGEAIRQLVSCQSWRAGSIRPSLHAPRALSVVLVLASA